MRALDRLISFIFSVIMLVLSVILILVGIGVVDSQMIIDMLNQYVFVKDMISANIFNPLTITGIVLLLLSLKTTVFLSLFKVKDKKPILVKTQNGEVEIAQETITNTVVNVGLSFENIKDVQAHMVEKRKGVAIFAVISLFVNSNLREITEEMQRRVKEVVKATTGVDVIDVNIKVKNVEQKQRKNKEQPKVTYSVEAKEPSKEEIVVTPVAEIPVAEEVKEEITEEPEQIAINEAEVTNIEETKEEK